jgi:hypothetical protein
MSAKLSAIFRTGNPSGKKIDLMVEMEKSHSAEQKSCSK